MRTCMPANFLYDVVDHTMKTVQVSEAVGNTLDWLVAKCEGHESRCAWMLEKDGYIAWQNYEQAWGNPIPKYSTDGGVAVPIIEREKLQLQTSLGEWVASTPKAVEIGGYRKYCFTPGPTFLIAAMRCYISSKLGDTVEIPEELL